MSPEMKCPFADVEALHAEVADGETKGFAAPAFVALSKFVIANSLTAEVKEAFRQRPHLVDGVPGFVRMEVLSPLDRPEEIWLITYWSDEQSFETWHHSHLYHDSHRGIPKGLKLVPGETQQRRFEFICA